LAAAFTALAIAEARANAVGAVHLSCGDDRLEIELIRVAWHAAGFAPGAVAGPVRFHVPYTAVRGLFRHGRALCLALDPAACAPSPYHRFALARFTDEPLEALARAYQARERARLASFAVPLPLGILAAAAAPPDLASGPLGLASLGAVVALASWLALRWLVHTLTWGGQAADRRRDALEAELSRRMGFVAAPAEDAWPLWAATAAAAAARGGASGSVPPGAPGVLGGEPREALMVRPRALLPVVLTAIAAVAVMAFVQRFATPRAPDTVLEIAKVAPAARAQAARWSEGALETAPVEPTLPRCLCDRADSPLWKEGLPRLSLLPSSGPDDGVGAMAPVEGEYDFDLAVVNNGSEPLQDVSVLLTFARRNEQDRRVGITERGLFYEGWLRPGRAIKWHVSAPGTEVKVEPSVTERAGEVAPPEAFFDLTRARYRAVRVHAATMLAYLRDPRALDALRALGPPSPTEAATFARIRRASAEVFPCAAAAEAGRLRVCVLNASAAPRRGATLRELFDADAPAAAQPRSWPIAATLPVHEGLLLDLPLQGAELPPEMEVELATP